jgi:hypothetical protein
VETSGHSVKNQTTRVTRSVVLATPANNALKCSADERCDYEDESDPDERVEDQLESNFAGAQWPVELGPKPNLNKLGLVCFESYKEPPEDQEYAAGIQSKVRASIRATVASNSLQLDPVVVSNGVFLDEFYFNDADEGEPRTVDASARIIAPN